MDAVDPRHLALAHLRTWTRERLLAEARLELHVQEARAAGATWGDVAAATGVTRQAARQRWGARELA